jgi:hypothetical protein
LILAVSLSACSSTESPTVEPTDPGELIPVSTFTPTTQIRVLTPTAFAEGGVWVDIIVNYPARATVIIDGVQHLDGLLESGTLFRSPVFKYVEIDTPHIHRLEVLINGVELNFEDEGGELSTYRWDHPVQPVENLILPTPTTIPAATAVIQSTNILHQYTLAESNANEPISPENAVRLMDLIRIDIGHAYEFEPAYSPDGLQLLYKRAIPGTVGSTGEKTYFKTIELLDLETGTVHKLADTQSRSTLANSHSVIFHPNGNALLAYGDLVTNKVELREDGGIGIRPVHSYIGGVSVTGQTYSPDGQYLLRTSFTGAVFLYRDVGWREVFSTVVEPYSYLDGVYIDWRPASEPAFTPDGQYFAVIGEGLHIWRTEDTSLHYQSEGAYYVDTSHLSIHGSQIAAAAPGNIYFLDIESKRITHLLPAPSSVTSIDFSADGKLVAVGTGTGGVFFYDPVTNHTVTSRQAHSDRITFLRFSPDGRWLSTISADGTLALWAIP